MASRLAESGAEILMIGRRKAPLVELAGALRAQAIAGDVTDSEFVANLPRHIEARWGTAPDILINNAGAFTLASFGETDSETFERLLAVNLRAPFELIRLWLPAMLARDSGHIVNIGSVAGRRAFPGNAAYCASKYGLRGLHEVLVEELRASGVRVTWIEPSAIDTPLWDEFDPDRRADVPSRGEMLEPGAVAEAVLFALVQPRGVSVEEVSLRANLVGRRS
ncbi:MAG: SDR family oxidoreductase [Gemmatimonadota bacterium]|nr:MAG: SDR family oxidoreductase [Gemmatimonadota bacterium]